MTDRPDAPRDDAPDPALEADLAAIVSEAFPPVPAPVVAAAKAALTWRNVDAELAELLESEQFAVRSGAAEPAASAYVAGDIVIDVEREGHVVLGQVGDEHGEPVGDVVVVVEVARPDGSRQVVEADLDSAGGFRAPVPAGQVRVAVTLPDGRRVVTPWLSS
jgi:hypothetical protein